MDYLYDHIETVLRRLKGAKRVFFLFDYDGTLTPIVPHPDQAFLPEKTRCLLSAIQENPRFRVAIVSGRSLEDIRQRVGLEGIDYVGNHGVEIFMAGGGLTKKVSPQTVSELSRLKERLEPLLEGIGGIYLEDKGCSLAVHYRRVDPKEVISIFNVLRTQIQRARVPLWLTFGKKVFEIRLQSSIHKGKAVISLLERFRGNPMEVFPLYFGDDRTDEDAFRVLNEKGLGIYVGEENSYASSARYYLSNPGEVEGFLKIVQAGAG